MGKPEIKTRDTVPLRQYYTTVGSVAWCRVLHHRQQQPGQQELTQVVHRHLARGIDIFLYRNQ
jgi:hypothetical protein